MSEPQQTHRDFRSDYPYFRRTWNRVVMALLAVSFVPLLLIGGGTYYYAFLILKQKTITAIEMELINHKNSIDQFMEERLESLDLVAVTLAALNTNRAADYERLLPILLENMRYFIDLGIIDAQGRHLAYYGPYDLKSKNYKDSYWFEEALTSEHYVSDVYLGFRQAPHFIMTVGKLLPQGECIVRATVKADPFDDLVKSMAGAGQTDAYIVNAKGVYQTTPRENGALMALSELTELSRFDGVRLETDEQDILAKVWLENAPWMCVVHINRGLIFESLHRVRNVAVFIFVLGSILIVVTVLLTTNHLVARLEDKRRSIHVLDQQVRRHGRLAATAKLFGRLVEQFNRSLIHIESSVDLIQEVIHGKVNGECQANLAHIKSELAHSHKLIQSFKSTAEIEDDTVIISDLDINALLDELSERLISGLFDDQYALEKDFDDDLPTMRGDRTMLSMLFQNIILTVISLTGTGGIIKLVTGNGGDHIHIELHPLNLNHHPVSLPSGEATPAISYLEPGIGFSLEGSELRKWVRYLALEKEENGGIYFLVELNLKTDFSKN